MLSRNEIKHVQSLSRKKNRVTGSVFIAEGVKIAKEMLCAESTIQILKIYALPHWQEELVGYESITTLVSEKELLQLSGLTTPNEIILVAEKKQVAEVNEVKNGVMLVLNGIQDPGNMGTIIRTADWFGVSHIIASEDCADVYNPKVIQAAMGSFIRVDVEYKSLHNWLEKQHVPVYGAVLNGKSIAGQKPLSDAVLLIGSEGKGITENLLPFITHPVTIPGAGTAESLNAGVAAGILIAWLKGAF